MGRILLLATVWTAAAFGATVDGRVVNAYTGAGVAGVAVSLMKAGASVCKATTDDQGHFRIIDVADGTYTPTYLLNTRLLLAGEPEMKGEPFTLTAEGHDVHLEFKVPPSGHISGRVLDRDGAPVPRAPVDIVFENHRVKLGQVITAGTDGRYNLENLPFHGSFVISAMVPPSWKPRESDGRRLGWAQTYYPGVTDPAAAARMTLPPSGELRDVDIKIAEAPVWHLRGMVVDIHGEPAPGATVALLGDPLPKSARVQGDGTFDFDAVADGVYQVRATYTMDGETLRGDQETRISSSDRNVQVQLFAPFPLYGTITAERPVGSPAPKLPTVRLDLAEGVPNGSGGFTLANVSPGWHRVNLGAIPNGFYLDSIALGGSETPGEQVQVLSGGASLEIRLKYGGGTVRGVLESCGGCDVRLVPTDTRLRNWYFTRLVSCAPDGTFEIPFVRPGQYYALALAPDNYVNITELEPYLPRAAVITVVDSETVRAEVPHLLK